MDSCDLEASKFQASQGYAVIDSVSNNNNNIINNNDNLTPNKTKEHQSNNQMLYNKSYIIKPLYMEYKYHKDIKKELIVVG